MDATGSVIYQIIEIRHQGSLLDLHFNMKLGVAKRSISVEKASDGETILISSADDWVRASDVLYEIYTTTVIDQDSIDSELHPLIGTVVRKIMYGVGPQLYKQGLVVFYFRLIYDEGEFLFLNNADEGYYVFNNTDEFLSDSLQDYKWVDHLPSEL